MSHFIVSLIRGKGADSEVLGAVRRQYPQGRVRTEDDVRGAESEQKTMSMGQSQNRRRCPWGSQKTVFKGQSQKTVLKGQSQKTVFKGQSQKTVLKGQSQKTMPVDHND